jgi:hypothetical protein
VVRRAAAIVAIATALGACGDFEDPAIVLDLRVLAVTATPPEYVIELDPMNPPDPADVMLDPFTVKALVADPDFDRPLAWSMTMCAQQVTEGGDGRCPPRRPQVVIGSGVVDDPDTGAMPYPTQAFAPDASTFVLLQDAIENDPLGGFSGIDLQIQLSIAPEGESLETTNTVAAKRVRFAAKIPIERVANNNPTLDGVEVDRGDPTLAVPLAPGRCVEQAAPIEVAPGETLHLNPLEPPGVREDYVVPTLDGGSRMFTENISYQWLAGAGSFSAPTTGGERDPFGNDPPLDTEWTAADDAMPGALIPLWVVARDERLGGVWFESCVRIAAP